MSEMERRSAHVKGPEIGTIFVLATSTTPTSIDLTSYAGKYVTITAETQNAYFLTAASQAAAELVDNSATSGDTRAQMLPANSSFAYVVNANFPWLGVETSTSTGKLRIHVSSTRLGGQ